MVKINDYLIKKENDGFHCFSLFKGAELEFAVYLSLRSAIFTIIYIINAKSYEDNSNIPFD